MECLTPPLDTVPVEEWFCPECATNNRHASKFQKFFVHLIPIFLLDTSLFMDVWKLEMYNIHMMHFHLHQ